MSKTPRTFAHILGAPWVITETKFSEIQAFVQARMNGESISFVAGENGAMGGEALIIDTGEETTGESEVIGKVAVIPVYGTLVKRGAQLDDSGQTGYVALEQHLRRAAADAEISAIVLDIDSPGGMADGVQGVANLIAEIDQNIKPVVAFANGCTCSGGYWLALGARSIITTEDVHVGSIGVRATHVDFSEAAKIAGFKFTELFIGEYKVAGTPTQPLSDRDRDYLKGHLDDTYTRFVSAVAKGREMTEAQALTVATGKVFNSTEAIELGLVDQIGTLTDAINLAVGETIMDKKTLEEKHPETFAQVKALGKEEAQAEFTAKMETSVDAADVTAETARCKALIELGGTSEMIAAAIDNGSSEGAYAKAVLAHERENPPKAETVKVDPLADATTAKKVKAAGQGHGDGQDTIVETFLAQVDAHCSTNGCKRSVSMTAVAKLNSAGHKAYLKSN